jgi:hypothetical protein
MGALRAVELAAFGMEGVGAIFEAYQRGVLEDDDEVAIAHGPAQVGFRATSEAMVDIRQTLRKAERVGVISKRLHAALQRIGKDLFYPDRNYQVLLRCASERGLPEADLECFRQWLPAGRVNQKREDALAMLRLMRRRLSEGLKPKSVAYSFEHTSMWEAAWRQAGELRLDSNAEPHAVAIESLLDEVRLEGEQYERHRLAALGRFFAIRESESAGMKVSKNRRRQTELAFRREHALIDDTNFEQWLRENGLSHSEFEALMTDEARRNWAYKRNQLISISCLPEQLRLSGEYPRLMARAETKGRLLQSLGLENPSLDNAQLTENQLVQWYFEEVLHRQVPDNLKTYANDLGLTGPEAFRRLLLKEYLYRRFTADKPIASR